MSKDAARPTPQSSTEDDDVRQVVRESVRRASMYMSRRQEFDEALECLISKKGSAVDPDFDRKANAARDALHEFIQRGAFARRQPRPVRVSRATKLARDLEKASVTLRLTMDAFLRELGEYARGPVLYSKEDSTLGPVVFNLSYYGTDPCMLEPGTFIKYHQTTRFRLQQIESLAALIRKSLPPDKGGRTNLDVIKNGKRLGQLVLEAGDIFSAFSTKPVTGTGTGPFMTFCIALLALAQRPVEREERRLRDFVEYGAPRIRTMWDLLQELQRFDPDEAIRVGRAHPYFQVGDRVEELRQEVLQGPPARKKQRQVAKE